MNIGKQLVRLSQLHGYSYKALAKHLNISEYQLRQCENKHAPFDFNLTLTLSQFFKVRTSYLTAEHTVFSRTNTVQRGHVSISNYNFHTHPTILPIHISSELCRIPIKIRQITF
ncbi:sigma-70 RNA polymerase sigma factor region 4 domain-containing protein [Staphylococcus simulans]|uniref:hypothetical protein n=1 Tax=Staphylococcus simulans TaxID=1286 RepID=UPI0021D44C12|nr:hypothetical protein [Staphylococcus simulans]UXR33162.1 hypothetical protein MUA81_02045 [Staphylococcus simulans]